MTVIWMSCEIALYMSPQTHEPVECDLNTMQDLAPRDKPVS
jgi:hypothetical protein